mgnify:CR=1 FL=1
MKKAFTLLAILFLPALIYIYFALGVPKVIRAPIYGPRSAIQVLDKKSGDLVTDTAYHTIASFKGLTTGGLAFDSKVKLDGRSYIAIFLPADSIKTMLPILAEDLQMNKKSFGYARFVFFLHTDSAGQVPIDAPDVGHDLLLGTDTAYTVFLTDSMYNVLHDQWYFAADPSRKKDPWQTTTDAVLIDRLGRIRGYHNIRYAAEIKKMKQDVNHILFHDEAVQTLEESKVEQKK